LKDSNIRHASIALRRIISDSAETNCRTRADATFAARFCVGFAAFCFMAFAEFGLAFVLSGMTPVNYIWSRDPVSGAVYGIALVLFAFMPAFVMRR